MRKGLLLLAAVVSVALVTSFAAGQSARSRKSSRGVTVENFQPVLTFDNQGPGPGAGRLMVQTRDPVTAAMRAALGKYGAIHGVIERYNIVAMTAAGPRARRLIESLPFVKFAEDDQARWRSDLGSWDRDILDVVDVEETGALGNPDAREVAETGDGVYVAVIDTGLIKLWRNFLMESRVDTNLARAFMGGGALNTDEFTSNPTNLWERDTNSHGTSVASHIIGFKISGLVVDGVAPGATVIPLKVFPNGQAFTFASRITAAIAYTTELKEDGVIGPTVINMSIGGSSPSFLERAAIQDAIANGVIVVVSAGNSGENGMGWPGAFPEVISAGATGWTRQFEPPIGGGFWWALDVGNDPDGTGVSEEQQSFVTGFSSRAIPARSVPFGIEPQQLDVLAPGQFTVAPCILPFAGSGAGTPVFCFWSGTSFSSPLTAGVAALMLDKNPILTQAQLEGIMKATALTMLGDDGRTVGTGTVNWDTTCVNGWACDPVGSGLLQADAALAAVP